MSRLPATTAALKMTATTDPDASVVGQPNHSSQNLPSLNSPHQHNRRIAPPYHGTPFKARRLMMSSLESNPATKPAPNAIVRLMMSSLETNTATKPAQTATVRLMMSSLGLHTAMKPVQTNRYHNSQ